MIDSASKFVGNLSRIMGFIGTTILLVMMMIVVVDVGLRYLINRPIPGIPELAEFAMICVGFLGIARCEIKGGHISVDLLVNLFPKKIQVGFDIIAHLIGIIVFLLIAWQGFVQTVEMRQMNNVSRTLHVPTFPFYFVLAIGCSVLCLALLVKLVQSLEKVLKK